MSVSTGSWREVDKMNEAAPSSMVAVNMGLDVPIPNKKCERPEVYGFLGRMLNALIDSSVPVDDLLSLKDTKNGEPGVKYELRHRVMRVAERGLVGACTMLEMQKALEHRWVNDLVGSITTEQPDIRWALIAADVYRHDGVTTVYQEARARAPQQAIVPANLDDYVPNLELPTRQHTEIVDHFVVVEAAFAGMGGDLVDYSDVPTPLRTYVQSRRLSDLPLSHRKQRARAEALVRRLAERREAVLLDQAAEPTSAITALQLAGAVLLFKQGWKWADLAAFFGVSHQMIRGAVQKAIALEEAGKKEEGAPS